MNVFDALLTARSSNRHTFLQKRRESYVCTTTFQIMWPLCFSSGNTHFAIPDRNLFHKQSLMNKSFTAQAYSGQYWKTILLLLFVDREDSISKISNVMYIMWFHYSSGSSWVRHSLMFMLLDVTHIFLFMMNMFWVLSKTTFHNSSCGLNLKKFLWRMRYGELWQGKSTSVWFELIGEFRDVALLFSFYFSIRRRIHNTTI